MVVIDKTVSFQSSTALKSSEIFQSRVHKTLCLLNIIWVIQVATLFLILGLFALTDSETPWMLILFALCPLLENMTQNLLIYIDIRNKLIESHGLISGDIPSPLTCCCYLSEGKTVYKGQLERFPNLNPLAYLFSIYFEQKLKDPDSRKILSIYQEFAVNMVSNVVQSVHFVLLFLMRGFNISVVSHFVIVKTAFQAIQKTINDVQRFALFRKFLKNLDQDFPMVKFELVENQEAEVRPAVNGLPEVRRVQCYDDCAIC